MLKKELPLVHSHARSGLTSILEPNLSAPSISMGILFPVGSYVEKPSELGFAHFVEHMLFKGTPEYSYLELNKAIERMGGYINAFTNRLYTYYYIHAIPENAGALLKILLSMMFESLFPEEEFLKEKKVILEEMSSYEDSPEDFVIEKFLARTYPQHYIGNPIIGEKATLEACSRDQLVKFFHKHYGTNRAFVSIAGNFDLEEMKNILDEVEPKVASEEEGTVPEKAPLWTKEQFVSVKSHLEQSYVAVGLPAIPYLHPSRENFFILNTVLGDSSTSRLFVELREKQGLCYGVTSFPLLTPYEGVWLIQSSTQHNRLEKLKSGILEELEKILLSPLKKDEIDLAKIQMKTSLSFEIESTQNIALKNAKEWLRFQKFYTLEELFHRIDQVSLDSIHEMQNELNNSLSYLSWHTLTSHDSQ